MQITSKTFLYAIHAIFKARNVGPGGSIPLDILAKEWRETRLRDVDLPAGLQTLEGSGNVKMVRTQFGTDVHLVNEGFGEAVTEEDRKAVAAVVLARKLRTPTTTRIGGAPEPVNKSRRASDKAATPTRR